MPVAECPRERSDAQFLLVEAIQLARSERHRATIASSTRAGVGWRRTNRQGVVWCGLGGDGRRDASCRAATGTARSAKCRTVRRPPAAARAPASRAASVPSGNRSSSAGLIRSVAFEVLSPTRCAMPRRTATGTPAGFWSDQFGGRGDSISRCVDRDVQHLPAVVRPATEIIEDLHPGCTDRDVDDTFRQGDRRYPSPRRRVAEPAAASRPSRRRVAEASGSSGSSTDRAGGGVGRVDTSGGEHQTVAGARDPGDSTPRDLRATSDTASGIDRGLPRIRCHHPSLDLEMTFEVTITMSPGCRPRLPSGQRSEANGSASSATRSSSAANSGRPGTPSSTTFSGVSGVTAGPIPPASLQRGPCELDGRRAIGHQGWHCPTPDARGGIDGVHLVGVRGVHQPPVEQPRRSGAVVQRHRG